MLQLPWLGGKRKYGMTKDKEETFASSFSFTVTARNQFSYDLYNKQQSLCYAALADLTVYCLRFVLFVK